jgi:hypothetical protein
VTDVPEDLAEKQAQLEAKLQPERIRATLAFAGLYQITHTLIQRAVLDDVREFYCTGFDEKGMRYDEVGYQAQVIDRAPNKFRASLLWLVDHEAITQTQADRLNEIYAHRHDLTHELIKYVVDVKFEPDVNLFLDALTILADIRRFWTQIEIDIGMFEHLGEVDVDEVQPLSLMILQQCIEAYAAGLPKADQQPS